MSIEDTLKATEQSWLKAEQNHDAAAFNKIVADDWSALTPDGKLQTKPERAAEITNNKNLSSATLSDIRVRVFGSTAVVTGSDDEVTSKDGKGVTDHYVWMDVFMKRNGRWLAVASQTALVK